ncbi:MAG: CsgG/HfaB family protein [Campylobacterota bacterium]|nr:CsgG/HfaB family protein [Campylobacterota bacterium]
MRIPLLLTLGTMLLFTGCSQKVKVHALQPAKVDRAAQTKTIAVSPFQRDRVGLSGKIESELASKRLDGKTYFTMISRNDIDKILQEQRLQNSGLLDESTSVEVGNLLGAQALISGTISNAASSDTHYREKRYKCLDKKCKEIQEYTVGCTKRVITLAAQIKMVDIAKGDIIYSDTFKKSREWNHCSDDSKSLPSKTQGLEYLASGIAAIFAQQLTPSYVTFNVILLEEPDIDYSDLQESLLENALLYIERQRYDKAEKLLSRLLDETLERSYVAAYNLGVVKEINGELNEAHQLYGLADSLTIEPVEEIDTAMLRIKNSITDDEQARKQIAQ